MAKALARDYKAMSGMVMGDIPTFESILLEINKLSETLNSLAYLDTCPKCFAIPCICKKDDSVAGFTM